MNIVTVRTCLACCGHELDCLHHDKTLLFREENGKIAKKKDSYSPFKLKKFVISLEEEEQ